MEEKTEFLMSIKQKQPPDVFYKKVVLINFAKFKGKHLYQSLFFNKVATLRSRACNFIKNETLAQVLLWVLRNV